MSIDYEKMQAERTKAFLAENPVQRREVLASFILSTTGIAQDLLKVTTLVNQGLPLTPDAQAAMDYMEQAINDACHQRLGIYLTEHR